jgi:hypothetical protein
MALLEAPTIAVPCAPPQALVELVKHSFLLDIEARDMLIRHFDDLTRLAELPIYFRLDYPRDYERAAGGARRPSSEHACGITGNALRP